MDTVLRAIVLYFALLFLMRIGGKRTLAQLTPFDFVLILIIGEATQQGLTGEDFSITGTLIVVTTLIMLDVIMSYVKLWFPRADKLIDGRPVLLVDKGRVLADRLKQFRVDEDEILAAARQLRGLEGMDQIKYAVLENDGKITIIPRSETS
jgi:uncharacterized membrane protein YcaP (DUF421 family)